MFRSHILVCGGTGCTSGNSMKVYDALVERIKKEGTTVLLVEQNANKALAVADRAYVLETGSVSMSGDAKALMSDERVRKAYLGA